MPEISYSCNYYAIILAIATVSCGAGRLVPDCSYCLKGDKANSSSYCGGNCQLNENTNLCETKGEDRIVLEMQ